MNTPLPPKSKLSKENLFASAQKPSTESRVSFELTKMLQIQSDLLQLCASKLESQSSSKNSLKSQLHVLNENILKKNSEIDALEHLRNETLKDLSQKLASLKTQNSEIQSRSQLLQIDINTLDNTQSELIYHKNSVIRQKETQEKILESIENQLKASQAKLSELIDQEQLLKLISESYQESLTNYQKKREDSYLEIKKLNNYLQELKGNIRVFCKIRPVLPEDESGPIQFELTERSLAFYESGKKSKYFFDRVFQPATTNNEIFEEISQLVQSALDGYKVCIFAYGQTGSGKTYTMEGNHSTKGIIQKSVELMFATQTKLAELGWSFEFTVKAVEIYNDLIRDLFDNGKVLTAFSINLIIPHKVRIFSYEDLAPLLSRARDCRAEAETKCNAHSSRSHFIFTVEILGCKNGDEINGTLNMIDLAGSERLKESQVEGERLVETRAINKSLSDLGTVIHALVNKDKHIPYRNSKLTSILQNCLGGDGKTLMFVNISPLERNTKETQNSLTFAQKVNACTLK